MGIDLIDQGALLASAGYSPELKFLGIPVDDADVIKVLSAICRITHSRIITGVGTTICRI